MKTYYIMNYGNGNHRIEEKDVIRTEEKEFILTECYTPEQLNEIKVELGADGFNEWLERKIDENIAPYLKGIVEAEQKPGWNELEYDEETETYFLRKSII